MDIQVGHAGGTWGFVNNKKAMDCPFKDSPFAFLEIRKLLVFFYKSLLWVGCSKGHNILNPAAIDIVCDYVYTSCEWQFLNHPKYEIVDPQKVWSWGKGFGSMGQVLTLRCLWQYSWLWLDLPSWGLEADMSLVGCYSKIWRIIRISKKKYKLYASNTHGCMCSLFCGSFQ